MRQSFKKSCLSFEQSSKVLELKWISLRDDVRQDERQGRSQKADGEGLPDSVAASSQAHELVETL